MVPSLKNRMFSSKIRHFTTLNNLSFLQCSCFIATSTESFPDLLKAFKILPQLHKSVSGRLFSCQKLLQDSKKNVSRDCQKKIFF